MRRLYALLAGLGLFSAALGCHHHVAGICDCDSCQYGCCGYGLCCGCGGGCGCGAPDGPMPPISPMPAGTVVIQPGTFVPQAGIMQELPKNGPAPKIILDK